MYLVLEVGEHDAGLAGVCALAVMAKAPRAGKVKTRLAPPLTLEESAALNVCFLRDTTRNIADVCEGLTQVSESRPGAPRAAGLVCYTPVGDEAAFDGILPENFALIAQRGDGFGERLLLAAEDILACGYGAVCLIDSDSPTMPAQALKMAVRELAREGERIVLGGSDDGGYYLIGMKRAHAAAFENVTWSTGRVYRETVENVRAAGVELVELPTWYDVDDGATLAVLERELLEGKQPEFAKVEGYRAEKTKEFLERRRASEDRMTPPVASKSGAMNRPPRWRGWVTNALLCVIGVGLVWLARQFVIEDDHFVLGFSGVSGRAAWLFVAAVIVVMTQPVNRATIWIVLGFAVAMRAMTLFAEPFLSSDIYRYVWDGIVQHAHVNPYRYVPGDAALSFLRAPHQEIFDNINRRDYARTIYPPVAQMVYWAVTLFSPTVTAMKAAMFGFECVTVGALVVMLKWMRRSSAEVLLYAWCPLLVWEIAGSGHVDAVVLCFVTLVLLARWRDQPVLTGLLLGCAVMTKFYPLVLLPALWKRGDWKMPATLLGVCVGGYAMYSSVGRLVFGFLGGYSEEEGINSGARFFLLELAQKVRGLQHLPVAAYLVFCAVVMGGICWWCWKFATVESLQAHVSESRHGAPRFVRGSMMLAVAMMLLFSPHYPWYLVWLIPFFALAPNLPLLVYLMGMFYLCTTLLADGTVANGFILNEILYGGVVAAFVLHLAMQRWPLVDLLRPRVRAAGEYL
jgi:rSAM/selenodomain-associated transferase 1